MSCAGQRRVISFSRASAGVGGGADGADDLIDVRDGDGEAAEDMAAFARLAEFESGAAGDNFLAEGDEMAQEIAQRQLFRAGRRSAPACCSRS